jgi:hypothetical protein
MTFRVYATFEQMHGHKSSLAELIERLKPFSLESVLYTCAISGMVLKLWQGPDWDRSKYDLFISTTFDQLRGDWYKLSARTENELVVHRRQLLLIMKLAIEHCPVRGFDLHSAPPGYFGTILLMANDQFHYGLFPFPEQDGADDREKVSRILAEFVPITEYGGFRIEHRLVRSHLMMTKYTEGLRNNPDFIDVAATYEDLTGLNLEDHEALTFGLFARCNMVTLEALQQNAWLAVLKEEDFQKTAIPRETIRSFLGEFAATSSELRGEIENARRRKQDHGANDFTAFRKKPLVIGISGMFPTDLILVTEKFETGPYWRVNDISRATGDKLRRFWGAVFEAYVNDQVRASAERSGAIFVPDPRWAGNHSTQVCDSVLVEGDALVLLEYKSNMFTAHAKYSGDHVALREEIVTKLVRNEGTGKKKGVEQLSEAVKRLLGEGGGSAIEGLQLGAVRRIYPLLVTLDDLGSTILMSRFLKGYFEGFLGQDLLHDERLRPVFCTDIESLEVVLPVADVSPLSALLQHWLDADPSLMATLLAHPPGGLPNSRNEMLYAAWEKLSEEIDSRLFPRERA